MEFSSTGDGFFRSADELISAIESELGPEAADALRRSRERRLQPRALTAAEGTELRTALEPVLRDLRTTGAIVPDVREQAWDDDPDFVFAWVESGSSGLGIRLDLGLPAAERVADLADQVQEWEVEELAAEGRPATWPECPEHPDSHPLAPETRDSRAVWSCPRSGHVIQPIGTLGLSSPVGGAGAGRVPAAVPRRSGAWRPRCTNESHERAATRQHDQADRAGAGHARPAHRDRYPAVRRTGLRGHLD